MTLPRSSAHPAVDLFAQVSLSFTPLLAQLAEALRRRQIRRSYGRMSDAQLRDIGLTPWELELALSQPLERDAGKALAEAARIEASKW